MHNRAVLEAQLIWQNQQIEYDLIISGLASGQSAYIFSGTLRTARRFRTPTFVLSNFIPKSGENQWQ
jgi:hypothetical protein